ncbi:MAG: hypothetical protein ABIF01_02355 [Candidatus Micrarchaeota archaeon]
MPKSNKTPEYDIPEDHVRIETPSGYEGPYGEDNVLSRIRTEDKKKKYGKRSVYAGRVFEDPKGRSIFVESWSYHSIFPSMRSWSSMIAIIAAPYAMLFLGIRIQGTNISAMGSMFAAAMVVLFVTAFLAQLRISVNHGVKDSLIHGLVLAVIALSYPWTRGAEGFINVAAIYLVSHIVAHGFDFHLERSKGRWWKLLFLVLFSTWALIAVGYGMFNLNKANVLS